MLMQRTAKALLEIRRLQKSADFLLRRAPFIRLIREIGQDFERGIGDHFNWSKGALEALQEMTEQFLVGLLADSQLLAFHAKRITLKQSDMQLAQRLRYNV